MDFEDSLFQELNDSFNQEDKVGSTYEDVEKYLEGQGYNLTELSRVLREQGTQQIVTGAGSGKTTAIILKALADLKTGNSVKDVTIRGMKTQVSEKIWISTFLRSGALDLQRTLEQKKMDMGITADTSNIKFSTLHAEFKSALNSMGIQTPILPQEAIHKFVRELAKDFGIGSSSGYPTNEEVNQVIGYLSAARNRLDPNSFYVEEMEDIGLNKANFPYILKEFEKKRRASRAFDFEDLQELLYKYAVVPETRNPNVTNFIWNKYDKIIIDEFQDVSEIQYEILKVYAHKVKSIIAVGDDDQSIYSWRGSNINIITKQFKEDFNPVINTLSVNYRCPSNILNPIAKSIVRNENRYDKPLKSAREGGVLNCYHYQNIIEMAKSIQEQLVEDVKEGKTVAVLGRTNPSLLPLSVFLDFESKINYSIRGTLYDLEKIKFKRYWRLAYLFNKSQNFLKENLRLLISDAPNYAISNLYNTLKTEGQSLFTIPYHILDSVSGDLAEYVQFMNTVQSTRSIDYLLATFDHIEFKTKLKGKNVEETLAILELLRMIISEGQCSTIDQFLYEIKNRNQRLKQRGESKFNGVVLTTVHDYKGKEADSVYVWQDTDTMFPSERSTDREFEEERRIHYIACTRAREKSTILTLMGKESPFIKEMGITPIYYMDAKGVSKTFTKEPVEQQVDDFIEEMNENQQVEIPQQTLEGDVKLSTINPLDILKG